MARRIQFMGTRLVESGGLGWQRNKDTGTYETEIFGIKYELEHRRRNSRVEPGTDTGWYLYSRNDTHFFGEWCGTKLFDAVEEASDLIHKTDLRGEGYEPKEDA